MDSVTAPTLSVTSTRTVLFATTAMPVCVELLKPSFWTFSSYAPGGKVGKSYPPVSLVTASRDCFVSMLVSVTRAPATTAPLASFTFPTIEPYSAWAAAGREMLNAHRTATHGNTRNTADAFMAWPLFGMFEPTLNNSSLAIHRPARKNKGRLVVSCQWSVFELSVVGCQLSVRRSEGVGRWLTKRTGARWK